MWSNVRWRLLMRLFFGRIVMARLGRAPSFFMDRRTDVGAEILKRTHHAMTDASAHENPFLVYALTGNYAPGALPRYLRPEHFEVIRARLGRLHLFRGLLEDLSDTRFDGFNLSDVFEYMTPEEHHNCYGRLVSGASDGARLVYWNLFSPRGRPAAEAGRVRTLKTLAHDLHRRDHAWFYQTLHVDEVISQGEANDAPAPNLIARSVA
jgi:S-adenosylmethionine-diacylglycerol 3-amino-3-carboxypropyl transferase